MALKIDPHAVNQIVKFMARERAEEECRRAAQRPLFGVKRTWRGLVSMSANDPKQTSSIRVSWPAEDEKPVL